MSSIKEQIKLGMKSEAEHHKGKAETLGIALDHLKEIPDYYTRLKKMEASAPKSDLNFKKQLMSNPILEAMKKHGKKKEEEKSETPEIEKEEHEEGGKDEKRKAIVMKLIALKKKK